MSTESNKAVVKQVFEAFNADDLGRLSGIFHEDYARSAPVGQVSVKGRAAFQADLQKRHDEYADAQLLVDDMVAEGDKVAVHFTLVGTHKATVMDVPASGRRIARSTMAIFTFRDGLICQSRMLADIHGLYLQLTGQVEAPTR